jgi:DNA-binding NarL/FixJ family response regulator
MSSLQGNALAVVETDINAEKYKVDGQDLEILSLIIGGHTNRVIARKLSISEESVERRLQGISRRFGISNRLEMVLFTIHHGLVPGKRSL